jgi:hypothetical protein
MNWEAFVDRYLDEQVSGFSENGQEKARIVIGQCARLLKPKLLRDVTAEALSRYQAIQRQRGLKEVTIKGYFSCLRPMLV